MAVLAYFILDVMLIGVNTLFMSSGGMTEGFYR